MANYKDILLISPDEVKVTTDINYNVSDDTTARAIEKAQNVYLREIIGTDLLDKLKMLEFNAIQEETPSIDDEDYADYKILLEDYIQPYLSLRTEVEVIMPISLEIRNIGAGAGKSDTNLTAATLQTINTLRDNYRTLSCDKENRLIEYLEDNRGLYPELGDCPCRKNNKLGERVANTGLWLGR